MEYFELAIELESSSLSEGKRSRICPSEGGMPEGGSPQAWRTRTGIRVGPSLELPAGAVLGRPLVVASSHAFASRTFFRFVCPSGDGWYMGGRSDGLALKGRPVPSRRVGRSRLPPCSLSEGTALSGRPRPSLRPGRRRRPPKLRSLDAALWGRPRPSDNNETSPRPTSPREGESWGAPNTVSANASGLSRRCTASTRRPKPRCSRLAT